MKAALYLAVVAAAVGLGWYFGSRPPEVPPRPPKPVKTDTVFYPVPSIPERVQELVFTPGTDVPFQVPYEVVIFQPDTVPCQEIEPRSRIMSAEFGEAYGDTSSVAIESMSYANGSLVFQSSIERLYTDGMPKRIWTESGQTKVEWIEYPVVRVNSCSIGTKLLSGAVGCGACTVLGLIRGN
jgi:hypothetical protein